MKFLYLFTFAVLLGSCKESEKSETKIAVVPTTEVKLVSVSEMEELLKNNNVQLVDVRTPEEFSQGHVVNAVNIDYKGADYEKALEVLDTTRPVMVYCRSGRRSGKGSEIIRAMGFKEVYDLKGGILQWEKEGKLIYTPDDVELK